MAAIAYHPTTREQLFIGGEWRDPIDGTVVDILSPASEEPVARAALGGPKDIDRAVRAARASFDDGLWSNRDPLERAEIVRGFGELIFARAEEFALIAACEVGSPVGPEQFRGIVAMVAKAFTDYYADLAATFPWSEPRQGAFAEIEVRSLPVGVVAAIVPWNVPLGLSVAKLAPALVAGATAVLKPAQETPINAYVLADLAREAGIPDGVLSVVPADREASETLVRHALVDKVSFTGSTRAGKQIAAICGEQLKRCSLELGGKSAAIILEDADVEQTLQSLVGSTCGNNGQICFNQTRVLAPRNLYDAVVDGFTDAYGAMTVGDPLDPATEIGPLINATQRERVEGYIASGKQEGARMTVGGGRSDHDRGHYVEPTVFADVDNSMKIAREEIFGPVLSIIPYETEREAVEIANDSPYGLSGSVWSADTEHAAAVARLIRSGTVAANSVGLDPVAPFGGFKESGIGREYGPEGLRAFLELQALHVPNGAGGLRG